MSIDSEEGYEAVGLAARRTGKATGVSFVGGVFTPPDLCVYYWQSADGIVEIIFDGFGDDGKIVSKDWTDLPPEGWFQRVRRWLRLP